VSPDADRVPPGGGDGGSAEDIEEIRKLKARYFRLLDQQDWQGLSDVFAPDAEIDVSSSTVSGSGRGVYSSRDSFVDTVSKLLHGAVTVHHGHTEEIELTGPDSATGVWAMEDRLWFPEGAPSGRSGAQAGTRRSTSASTAAGGSPAWCCDASAWRSTETRSDSVTGWSSHAQRPVTPAPGDRRRPSRPGLGLAMGQGLRSDQRASGLMD